MNFSAASVVELRGVSTLAGSEAPLRKITLGIAPGALTLLRGEPDSGHRRLWRLLALLEAPAEGSLVAEGAATDGWDETRRAAFRAERCVMLYADPFLLPSLTVIENVAMPLLKKSPEVSAADAGRRAHELLSLCGLAERAEEQAGGLLLAEQYGVALARALATGPALLLVEEPESKLQGEPLQRVAGLLRRAAVEKALAVVATVSPRFAGVAGDRIYDLEHGRLRECAPVAGAPE